MVSTTKAHFSGPEGVWFLQGREAGREGGGAGTIR